MKIQEQDEVIHRAMQFSLNEVIARYARDWELSYEDAERHVFELRRFLALCALNDGPAYGMRGQIDEAWHTFIIFTREYSEFCQAVAGRFLHHRPNTDSGSGPSGLDAYQRFLSDYERTFREPAPADLWPRPFASPSNGSPCGGCSNCGTDDGPAKQLSEGTNCDGCNQCSGRD